MVLLLPVRILPHPAGRGYSQRPTVLPSWNLAPMNPPAGPPLSIGLSRMVTVAPGGNVDGRIPCRPRLFGLPHSTLHSIFWPFSSSTITWIQLCGFLNWNSLIVPVISLTLVLSNRSEEHTS